MTKKAKRRGEESKQDTLDKPGSDPRISHSRAVEPGSTKTEVVDSADLGNGTKAGGLTRSAKTDGKQGKAAKKTKSQKSAKRSKAKPGKAAVSVDSWFFEVPSDDCLAPRDGKYIERSIDYLFIAVLVERSRESGWIKHEKGEDKSFQYVTSRPPDITPGHAVPHYYATKTLRRLLTRQLNMWRLRLLIQNATPPPHSIKIAGHLICAEGSWRNGDGKKALASMRHPIEIGREDSFIASLHKQRFFSWRDLLQPFCLFSEPSRMNVDEHELTPLKCSRHGETHFFHQLICPIDGPVVPIEVNESSPAITWEDMCGRAYTTLHCPHCLAALFKQRSPRVMN
ncbi:MAG: hypothetical protein U1F81_04655 [Verrucomicrobiaceae bacterium]